MHVAGRIKTYLEGLLGDRLEHVVFLEEDGVSSLV